MHAEAVVQDRQVTDNDVVEWVLDALIEGNYSLEIAADDALSSKLEAALAAVRKRASRQLADVVDGAMAVCDAAVQTAYLMHDFQNVGNRSGELAEATGQMSTTIDEIGDYGKTIAAQTSAVSDAVQRCQDALKESIDKSTQVAQSVSETSELVVTAKDLTNKVYDISVEVKKISSQTKLLAINAAVEAARAGEAGKGFAVVAAEVKALSDRTAMATESTSAIVEQLHASMDQIGTAMSQSTDAVSEGRKAVGDLHDAVEDVRTKNITVNENVERINESLSQQRGAAQSIADEVEVLASTTSSGSTAIEALNRILDAIGEARAASSRQLEVFGEIDVPKKVIKLAQADHVIWKLRLINMLIGREQIDSQELADHHSCRLGKWYDAVDDQALKGHRAFQKLSEPHRQVHQEGIAAASAFNAGRKDQAIRHIEGVEAASADVVNLLRQLER